jgi:hypothetical protein
VLPEALVEFSRRGPRDPTASGRSAKESPQLRSCWCMRICGWMLAKPAPPARLE